MRWTAAYSLLLGTALVVAGAVMFVGRRATGVTASLGSASFTLERSLLVASVVATTVGLASVAELTRGTRGSGPTMAGAIVHLYGGVLITIWELARVGGFDLRHSMVVGYVILAFLGQAVLGSGLIMAGEPFTLAGWAAIVWNLGALISLSLASPGDMYFPILHNVIPTAIGVTILARSLPT